MAWRDDGNLLFGDRLFWNVPPNYSDRIHILDEDTGNHVAWFTSTDDTHLHLPTAIFQIGFGFAEGDYDGDGDADLEDFAAFQNCYGPTPSQACLDAFDDELRTGEIGPSDYAAFASLLHGPTRPCAGEPPCDDGSG